MADPAQDEENQILADQAEETTQAPEAGGQVVEETKEKADPSENDPLVMAQMSVEKADEKPDAGTVPAKTTVKTGTPVKTATTKSDAQGTQAADPATTTDDDDPEIAEAVSDLAKEDWERLTHKGKSQFLSQRKAVKALADQKKKALEAAKVATENYQTVEKFVRDAGLTDEEYLQTVVVSSLAKRGDPRAIPVLEERLRAVRKAAGIPEPQAQTELDADLAAVLKDAEDFGIDTSKVRAKYQAKPEAKPTSVEVSKQQQQTVTQQQPQAQVQQDVHSSSEVAENQSIVDALVGLGVAEDKVVEHISGLIQSDPTLAKQPVGKRLRAVLTAHQKVAGTAKPVQQTRAQSAPLSGRGGPPVRSGPITQDPVRLATMPRGR